MGRIIKLRKVRSSMTYFKQVIFNPISKQKITRIFVQRYWFEFTGTEARFMVRCPVCAKTYCYCNVRSATRWDLLDEIEKNEPFFIEEWSMHCPDNSIHNELLNIAKEI